jgi:hypothetical protein
MSLKARVTDKRSSEQPLVRPVNTFRAALVASHLGMLLVYPLVRYIALKQDWNSRYARIKTLGELQALVSGCTWCLHPPVQPCTT